jgi:hypothetical protein
MLAKQNEANADANKNLPELQEKLKIHDPKPPRKEEQGENPEGNVEGEEEFDQKVEEKKRGGE